MNLMPIAVAVSALALSPLVTGVAHAQVASDVVCNLCVNNSDLSNNSVTSGRIVDGTIKTNDIAAGGARRGACEPDEDHRGRFRRQPRGGRLSILARSDLGQLPL